LKLVYSGKYCGPGFCGGKKADFTTNKCDMSVRPTDDFDACCKAHDDCCINNRGKCGHCEPAVLSCWDRAINAKKCKWYQVGCNLEKTKWKGIRAVMAARPKGSCC